MDGRTFKRGRDWRMTDILDILRWTQGRMLLAPQHPSSGSGLRETEVILTHGIMTWNGALGFQCFCEVAITFEFVLSALSKQTGSVLPLLCLEAWLLIYYFSPRGPLEMFLCLCGPVFSKMLHHMQEHFFSLGYLSQNPTSGMSV